jgi:toxin ParE1/3/4
LAKNSEFHPFARREFDRAIEWYNEQKAGLGGRFARRVLNGVREIERNPLTGSPSDHGTRALSLRTFPYRLVFKEVGATVWIVAIAHHARHPEYWLYRLTEVIE